MTLPLRIGTRGSALALWQARTVAALLEARGHPTELVTIKTDGDRLQDAVLSQSGGKGLFVKEIEDALLARTIDLAVHSAKDMSVTLPDGLGVAAVLPREDSRDALVFKQGRTALGDDPAIGTSSVRRSAQLTARFPRARFLPVRGNVDTRLRKVDEGEYDALVLAAAGLKRLGLGGRISELLSHDDCIPAPGQGIVAIETRADADGTRAAVEALNDPAAFAAFTAERAVVAALGGGCQLPLGAIAVFEGDALAMQAIVISPDGRRRIVRRGTGEASRPAELGRRIAAELANAGAIAILAEVR
ncbi:MAG TPA: hydroxymethylbilane synthase [Vicinamibacterales bacterium]|nr:hydroxymethylbilane synthase [Vicinamibacterales bacterium]